MREVRRWDYPLYDDRTVLVAAVEDLLGAFEDERDRQLELSATHVNGEMRVAALNNANAMRYAIDVANEALALEETHER